MGDDVAADERADVRGGELGAAAETVAGVPSHGEDRAPFAGDPHSLGRARLVADNLDKVNHIHDTPLLFRTLQSPEELPESALFL